MTVDLGVLRGHVVQANASVLSTQKSLADAQSQLARVRATGVGDIAAFVGQFRCTSQTKAAS